MDLRGFAQRPEESEVSGFTRPLKETREQNSVWRALLGEGAVYIVCGTLDLRMRLV